MDLMDGLNLNLVYTGDVQSVVSGGLHRDSDYLGVASAQATLDGDKLFHVPGSTVFLHLMNHHGGHTNNSVGSVQGVDSLEAPVAATLLYEAWAEKNWLDDRLSVRFGLYDLNTEFYVNDPALLFINPAFGIGQEMAQAGLNGPSIYPYTSLAARILVKPTEWSYLQFMVGDGVSGDPAHPRGTHVKLDSKDGTLQAVEAGINIAGIGEDAAARGKVALGAWRFTMPFDDLADVDLNGNPARDNNYGAYALANYRIYSESSEGEQGISAFARWGFANDRVNQTDQAFEVGLTYLGLIPGRDQDLTGFGVVAARNGSPFRSVNSGVNGDPLHRYEVAYELTYQAVINNYLNLQPVVQYVDNSDPAIDNAVVLTLRLQLSY